MPSPMESMEPMETFHLAGIFRLTECFSAEIEGEEIEGEEADVLNLDPRIELAAEYICQNTNENGRLAYERHVNPKVKMNRRRYNVLRHAGTIYAAYLYELEEPENEEIHAVRVRLSEYLLKHHLREIDGEMYTISSNPKEESLPEPQAKLGAAGLALIGMSNLLPEEKVSLKVLRGLGEFVLFMQKEDGSFHSKYIYSTKSFDLKFHSGYYPGEAALGLLYLWDVDPQEKWLLAAKRALLCLAERRRDEDPVREFDHWAMLATEKLLTIPDSVTAAEKERLVFHAVQMAEMILPTQVGKDEILKGKPEYARGSMGKNISPCSNGTKLEGLAAVYRILEGEPEYRQLQKEVLSAMDELVEFLARVQILNSRLRGGFPSSADWRIPGGAKKKYVVRIDNVQHILSGWINYRKIRKCLD